ncbi:hypothetical protein BRADI_3g50355v3 [Brachypodium distachyon]|uniref:Uncharacterized protein n=1 Tax=Brachypodium distachyon TaxID=15368 RepID=A0A2K2D4F3_BRADI|nr:hypothetical protein BRADI_3g50355v3 [Brachypodium distachyon]
MGLRSLSRHCSCGLRLPSSSMSSCPVTIFFPWPSSLFPSPSSSSPHLPSPAFSPQSNHGEDDEREDVRSRPRGTDAAGLLPVNSRVRHAPPATRAAANQPMRRPLSRIAHAMTPALFADPMRCSTFSPLSRRSPTPTLPPPQPPRDPLLRSTRAPAAPRRSPTPEIRALHCGHALCPWRAC